MSLADDLVKLDELRRAGALTEKEFALAKAQLLGPPPPESGTVAETLVAQLADPRYQHELDRIDREWVIEKEQYLVPDRYGKWQVPTTEASWTVMTIVGPFGLLCSFVIISILSDTPDVSVAKLFFSLLGVAFFFGAIGYGIYLGCRAEKYNRAFAAYQSRRATVQRTDAG